MADNSPKESWTYPMVCEDISMPSQYDQGDKRHSVRLRKAGPPRPKSLKNIGFGDSSYDGDSCNIHCMDSSGFNLGQTYNVTITAAGDKGAEYVKDTDKDGK